MKKIVSLILLVSFFISCKREEERVAGPDSYYTCSMDPQVRENEPGKCPVCKMPLTQVKKASGANPDEIELSEQQIQLGNIKTDSLREHLLGEEILLTGTINTNQNTLASISARVMGRIEKLYFKTTGELIRKGDALYEIYSEELNATISELLLALEKRKVLAGGDVDYEKILESARNRLLLFGLTEEQIKKIAKENKLLYTVPILSKMDGVIYSVDASEGDYVMEGKSVFHIADFKTVWAEAQVYADYLGEIRQDMEVRVTLPSQQGKEMKGKIQFINPELTASSKINLVRIELANPDLRMKPGMQVNINLLLGQKNSLSIPSDAVLRDGKGATIWIQTSTRKFKSVMVHTGLEANGYTEILHGLAPGQLVVVSGAYLVNSEFVLKKGASPMAGHDMEDM